MKRFLGAVLAGAFLLLAGCGGSPSAPDVTLAQGLAMVQGSSEHMLIPFSTQRAMLKASDVAVSGVVTSVSTAMEPQPGNSDKFDYPVVLIGVLVDRAWKGRAVGETVYFILPRPDNVDADFYRPAFMGARTVLLGYQLDTHLRDGEPGTIYTPAIQGLRMGSTDSKMSLVFSEGVNSRFPATTSVAHLRTVLSR